jgi:hypothetical protein
MKLKRKNLLVDIVGITAVVITSISLAFIVEAVLLRFTTITDAQTKLIFAFILPLSLLLLQHMLYQLKSTSKSNKTVNSATIAFPEFDPLTQRALLDLRSRIASFLQSDWAITHNTLVILDWQRKHYTALNADNPVSLPQNHALVHFANTYKALFCTERRLVHTQKLSEAMNAEILVFMQKHHYVFAIPLFTAQDVYGFIFLTLADVKDSKLFATNDFESLEKFGQQCGSLLHQTLIYQAVVGKTK